MSPAATSAPSASRDTRLGVAARESDTDPARRDASIAEQPIAPPATSSALVRQESVTAITRGVAGGIASDVVALPPAETKEMLGAVVGVSEREARAKTSQRAISVAPSAQSARALDSPSAVSAVLADRAAERIGARVSVTGCWRVETTARVDSVQTSLRIVRTVGDTLVLALTPLGAEAHVVWEADDLLRGRARDAAGGFVGLVATRTRCAP